MELLLLFFGVLAILFVIVNIKARDWSNPWFWAIIVCLILVVLGY